MERIGENSFKMDTQLQYDSEQGEVTMTDQLMRQVIGVRTGLVDKYIRQAVILELERLGYTVISPAS